jgi:hypothetical protein
VQETLPEDVSSDQGMNALSLKEFGGHHRNRRKDKGRLILIGEDRKPDVVLVSSGSGCAR